MGFAEIMWPHPHAFACSPEKDGALALKGMETAEEASKTLPPTPWGTPALAAEEE